MTFGFAALKLINQACGDGFTSKALAQTKGPRSDPRIQVSYRPVTLVQLLQSEGMQNLGFAGLLV